MNQNEKEARPAGIEPVKLYREEMKRAGDADEGKTRYYAVHSKEPDTMSYIYDQRKRLQGQQNTAPEPASAPGPDLNVLMTGAARPSAAQKGRPIDLDAAMKARMEHAFGDLSAVKLYESPTVGQAGAEAIAMGNEIAFAPGMADFSSRAGQERLGHELSHVMSQRSGTVRGEGFLANSALEARADREGARAAAGEQVYPGPVISTLSGASPSPSAAGPMQAKRRDADAEEIKEMQKRGETKDWKYALPGSQDYDSLDPEVWEEKTHKPGFSRLWGKKKQSFKVFRGFQRAGLTIDPEEMGQKKGKAFRWEGKLPPRPGFEDFSAVLKSRYSEENGYKPNQYDHNLQRPANPVLSQDSSGEADTPVFLTGQLPDRILGGLMSDRNRGFNMSKDEIIELYDKLMAPHKTGLSDEEQLKANQEFDEGILQYKQILADDLNHMENKYGRLLTQMHPEDLFDQLGNDQLRKELSPVQQDPEQLFLKGGGRYFDFENNKNDQKFRAQATYFSHVNMLREGYALMGLLPEKAHDMALHELEKPGGAGTLAADLEQGIGGPQMDQEQYDRYLEDLQKRKEKKLFGRFRKKMDANPG